MARCVQSRVIVTEKVRSRVRREKARLRALRERRTIPSPSGKSTIRVLRKKVRSECFGKSAVRASRGRCMIPSPSGKSTAPSRVIVTEKSAAQSIPVKVHSSEYFGKDKGLNRSAASRAVYKENPGSGKEAVYFSVTTRKIFVVFARVCEEEARIIGGIKGTQGV